MSRTIVMLCFLPISLIPAQLIGSRGVFKLKEGYEYRDKQTVAASEAVGRYAKKFQPFADNNADRSNKGGRLSENSVNFFSFESKNKAGRQLRNSEIFDFQSSRLLSPLVELRSNQPLQEIETERSTSSARLLPEESQPVTKPSVITDDKQQQQQHAANRLRGTSRIKQKVRSQEIKKQHEITRSQASYMSPTTKRTKETQQSYEANNSRGSARSSYSAYTAWRTKFPSPEKEFLKAHKTNNVGVASYHYGQYGNSQTRYQPATRHTQYTPYSYQGTSYGYYPSTVPGLLYSLVITHLA